MNEKNKFFIASRRLGKTDGVVQAMVDLMDSDPNVKISVYTGTKEDNIVERIPMHLRDRVQRVEVEPDRVNCPQCGALNKSLELCESCSFSVYTWDDLLTDYLQALSGTELYWLECYQPRYYVNNTPEKQKKHCVWYGFSLTQIPHCRLCTTACTWEQIRAAKPTDCKSTKHRLVLCEACEKKGNLRCQDCNFPSTRGMDTSLIWIDESEFIPSEEWEKLIEPLNMNET